MPACYVYLVIMPEDDVHMSQELPIYRKSLAISPQDFLPIKFIVAMMPNQ